MDKILHVVDYDKLHIYMVAQILGISEDSAQRMYDDYFEEEEDHE